MNIFKTAEIAAGIMLEKKLVDRICIYIQAKEKNFSLDPETIKAILNCIIAIAGLLYKCYGHDPSQYYGVVQNPGLFSRWMVSLYTRKYFRFKPSDQREIMCSAMMDTAKGMSEKEIQQLISYANGLRSKT